VCGVNYLPNFKFAHRRNCHSKRKGMSILVSNHCNEGFGWRRSQKAVNSAVEYRKIVGPLAEPSESRRAGILIETCRSNFCGTGRLQPFVSVHRSNHRRTGRAIGVSATGKGSSRHMTRSWMSKMWEVWPRQEVYERLSGTQLSLAANTHIPRREASAAGSRS
jgi:hypothetical protein